MCVIRLLQLIGILGRDRLMSTSVLPSSFTLVLLCTKSIFFTCSIRILVTCCIRILVTCCIRILVTCTQMLITCCIQILVTCFIRILVTCYIRILFNAIINHIHKQSVMTGNRLNIPARTIEDLPLPSPQEQLSWQWQRFFITDEPLHQSHICLMSKAPAVHSQQCRTIN